MEDGAAGLVGRCGFHSSTHGSIPASLLAKALSLSSVASVLKGHVTAIERCSAQSRPHVVPSRAGELHDNDLAIVQCRQFEPGVVGDGEAIADSRGIDEDLADCRYEIDTATGINLVGQ